MREVKVTPFPDVVRHRDFTAPTEAIPHGKRITFDAINPDDYPGTLISAGNGFFDSTLIFFDSTAHTFDEA